MTILVTWTPYDLGARNAELIADPFSGFTTTGTVIGGASALDTADGDTSYVEVTDTAQTVSFQLAPDKPVPSGALVELWWEATYRIIGVPTFGADYRVYVNGPTIRGTFGTEDAPLRPVPYTSVEWFHLTPAYSSDAANLLQAAVDQPETVYGVRGPNGATVRITFLRMFSLHEGDDLAPLRIFQRGDNLGAGSGRVIASGTRQSSTKVFGAL